MIVLKAWCASCTAEGVENPGRLGKVQRNDDGAMRWMPTPRSAGILTIGHPGRGKIGTGKLAPDELSPILLSTPLASTVAVPEFLDAACKRHGVGTVRSADLVGKTGSVVLTLIR